MDECLHLRKQIEEAVRSEQLSHLIKELKQGPNKGEHAKTTKKGETSNKEKAEPIFMTPPRNKKQDDSGYDPASRVQLRNIMAVGANITNGIAGRREALSQHKDELHEGGIVTLHSSTVITAGCDMVAGGIKEPSLIKLPPAEGMKVAIHPGYPLLEINWKIESLCGYPFKCFLDAYKGYHNIQMAEEDEEKTTFHTNQGVFCYMKMPFGLKNAGATYQRFVDKAFEKLIERNLEVYVDDLVIKSHTEQEIPRDIEETFKMLRRINMKLNPKKCTFGAEEGMFLGHIVNVKGIRACPDKAEATPEAEKAFQAMKQCIAELPMVTTPKPREELIIYLYAAREEISAAPKVNYRSMEKLVLALVHASWRLRRYFQANPIVVITDQPIKQILSRPENTERILKWKFKLEVFDITYRPRTSIRGKAEYVVREIHEGSCCMHSGLRSVVAKALRSRYYWPTMHKDARNIIRKCKDCQVHRPVPKNPQQKLTPITSPWPFYKWGIDISRPFLEAQGKVKFLIVAIDYFTKWIEAKPVATITGNQIKKFAWDNIVCRFGLPGEIISDNGKQFMDNPFKD
ncbi:reverse transcriptase domain-containing protein [Tanacetum coccineum]